MDGVRPHPLLLLLLLLPLLLLLLLVLLVHILGMILTGSSCTNTHEKAPKS